MKRFMALTLGIVLIALLVFVNRNMNKGTEVDPDEAAQQQAQAAQAKAAQKPPLAAPPTADPSVPGLPSDEVLGNPQAAKYKVLFGYTYDETSQVNPQSLAKTVMAVRAAVSGRPDVFAVIADVDVPAEDRTPAAQSVTQEGLTVNGVPTDPAQLATALKR